MKHNSVKWFNCLFIFVFLIVSCAGTELIHTKVNEEFKDKPVSDILIIAITGNEHNRRVFERKFVEQLNLVGVEAISSENAISMPADLKLKKETILNAINKFENDAVIITHLIDKGKKDVHTRGSQTSRDFYGYYLMGHNYAYDPGYSSTRKTQQLETNLYDVKTEKLIWSGRSKTWSKDSKNQIINDVIKVVINDLQNNKLISPK